MTRLSIIGIVMTATISASCQGNKQSFPSGASIAFTSTESSVVRARELFATGNFVHATKALDDARDSLAKEELIEIMRRQRQDYSATEPQLLATMKKDIPDVTAADIQRWC